MGEQRAMEFHARKSFTVQARKGERGFATVTARKHSIWGRALHPQSPSYYCEHLSRWGSCVQIRCEILNGSAELFVLLRVLDPVQVRLQVIPAQLALSAIVETAVALKRLRVWYRCS